MDDMVATVIAERNIDPTIRQVKVDGNTGSTSLCAYHSQNHHRESGKLCELLFHFSVSFYLFVVVGLSSALC